MRVCIDTTVLIDILKDEFREFQDMLYTALETGETLVSPAIVYGELMPQFRGDTTVELVRGEVEGGHIRAGTGHPIPGALVPYVSPAFVLVPAVSVCRVEQRHQSSALFRCDSLACSKS